MKTVNVQLKRPRLFQVMFGVVVSFLKKKTVPTYFPEIGKYKIISKINKAQIVGNFSLGIYTDGTEKVFIKTWSGLMRDFNYYSLVNEYFANTVMQKKLSLTLYRDEVYIPIVKDVICTKGLLALVFEYKDGKHLETFSQEYQKEVLVKVCSALSMITDTFTAEESAFFARRSHMFYVLSFPLVFTAFAFLFPKKILLATRASIKSISSIGPFFKQRLVVAHRDITPQNLLVQDGKIYLLDCEEMALAPASSDVISCMMNPDFTSIRSDLVQMFLQAQNSFLQMYLTLHVTLGVYGKLERRQHYLSLLKDSGRIWEKDALNENTGKETHVKNDIKEVPRVVVGISALNEEYNIARLINQILKQQEHGFKLESVIVVSDGSTDATVETAESVGDDRVQVIRGEVRQGKASRMNEIFEKVETDIIVLFDADVELTSDTVLTELLAPMIIDPSIGLVFGTSEPQPPKNFIQKAVFMGWKIWHDIRIHTSGAEMYRSDGTIRAFRRYLYKTIRFPNASGDDTFAFLYCMKHGHPVSFAPKAIIRYWLPSTYKDQFNQTVRFMSARGVYRQYFDDDFLKRFYVIKTSDKVKALVSHGLRNPFLVFSYLVIYMIPRTASALKLSRSQTAFWKMATSTKKN